MKINYKLLALVTFSLGIDKVGAQCASPVQNGSSANMFTQVRNATNPVAADKNLNTIIFIHRNNTASFGDNSGQLRYDVSTNAGATWTNEIGYLNPQNLNYGRYPNVAIYNPTTNTNPSNAYLCYLAATIHSTSQGWNGCVTGAAAIGTTLSSEHYNQPITATQLIPHSVVKGAPGVFWAADALFNGVNITGFAIYKGTWNNSTNDIIWAPNFTVTPPFNTGLNAQGAVADYNIAFDPTGTTGWFSFLGHVTPGPSNYAYYPVFYKTTNGGQTWSGPIQVDLNTLSCMTGNLASNNVVTTNFEHDLTVDVNGDPHLFTTICNGTNAYSVLYAQWHHMFDITLSDGLWVAHDVSNVLAGRGNWGTAANAASMDMAPQVARTADGSKVFFTWVDNSNYTTGNANLTPNLFTRAYDVVQKKWTAIKDVTSCNNTAAGKIFFPHTAAEVLEPSGGTFKLATVYGAFQVNTTDPGLPTTFSFLDNVTYASTDFSINPTTGTITITQGTNLLLCPNTTLTINVAGAGQAIWNTGATTTSLAVTQGTASTYSVIAQAGCITGTAGISVVNLTMTASASAASVCAGSTVALNVSGNSTAFTWNPGNMTGTAVTVTASSIPVYTVNTFGSGGCSFASTVGLHVFPLPTITVSGNNTICSGSGASLTATGAASYFWSDGTFSNTAVISPTSTAAYSVDATDQNSCAGSKMFTIYVNPLPAVTATADKTVICLGHTTGISAGGADTYSWSTGGTVQTTSVSPSATTEYTVWGTDQNSCTALAVVNVSVSPLPTVSIVSTRTIMCKGEKAVSLLASGAANYTWTNGPTSATFLTLPTTTTTYTLTGETPLGCRDTTTFMLVFSNCNGLADIERGLGADVFPNPARNEVKIRLSEGQDAMFEMTDLFGRTVRAGKIESGLFILSMADIPSGIYVISVSQGARRTSVRLVRE